MAITAQVSQGTLLLDHNGQVSRFAVDSEVAKTIGLWMAWFNQAPTSSELNTIVNYVQTQSHSASQAAAAVLTHLIPAATSHTTLFHTLYSNLTGHVANSQEANSYLTQLNTGSLTPAGLLELAGQVKLSQLAATQSVPDGSQLVSANELTAVQNYLTTGNYEPFAAQLGQILGSSEASVNSAQLAPLFIAYGSEVETLAQSLLNQAQNGASQQSLINYANDFFVDTLSKLGQTTLNSRSEIANALQRVATQITESSIWDKLQAEWQRAQDQLSNWVQNPIDSVKDKVDEVLDKIKWPSFRPLPETESMETDAEITLIGISANHSGSEHDPFA